MVVITRQGTTIIRYRSVDTDGNVEAIRICRVFIDTTPPAVRDGGEVNVFRGGLASFTYRLSDNLAKSLRCWLVIRHHGKVVSRTPLGLQPVGRLLSAEVSCTMRPGLYSWRIIAKDTAGNGAAGAGQELEVKLARH